MTDYGTVRDGTGLIAQYLEHDAGDTGYIRRFGVEPPTVRVAEGATPEMIRDTIRALQTINASLPDTWQLRFASEPPVANTVQPPDGQIVVEFQPREEWPVGHPLEPGATGFSQRFGAGNGSEIVSGHVWIDTGGHVDDQPRTVVIVHELLHALGRNRLDGTQFVDTVMNKPPEGVPGHVLHPLDREALLAVYGWLKPNTRTDQIFEELEAWSEQSVHLFGQHGIGALPFCDGYSSGELSPLLTCAPRPRPHNPDIPDFIYFGVGTRNGLAQPWVTGPSPLVDLQENPSLSNTTVRWSGPLLGFTSANRSVEGWTVLELDTESLDGELEFSRLESGPERPGTVGTSTQWGDGNLEYTITVRGNTFVQTGGDDGVVTGVFLGEDHRGMGGVLKRDDLAAAFAGGRWPLRD